MMAPRLGLLGRLLVAAIAALILVAILVLFYYR
jgi:hypothetical protein